MKKFSKTFESIDDRELEDHIHEFSQDFKDEGYTIYLENESNPKIDSIRFYITIQKSNEEGDRFDTVLYQEMLEEFLDRLFDIYPNIDYMISTEMKFDKCRVRYNNDRFHPEVKNYINTDIKLMNKEINLRR